MSASSIPLWGQSWELTVYYATASGSPQPVVISCQAWEPEALRVTFEIAQSQMPSAWWSADINVYNFNTASELNALYNATWVTLSAGFQYGPQKSSVIWNGPVLQVLIDRENVVDQRVCFHSVASPLIADNLVSLSVGAQTSQLTLLSKMVNYVNSPALNGVATNAVPAGGTPLSAACSPYVGSALAKQYPRGNTVFGKLGKQMQVMADDHFVQNFRTGLQVAMSEISTGQTSPTPALVYSPPFPPNAAANVPAGVTQSIIGTPRQTPFGVVFQVLLDPRLQVAVPPMVVQLDYTLITQAAVQLGELPPISLTGNNTLFFVAALKHVGDSRGNDWQTEVTGFSTAYAANLLDGVFNAAAS